jgi:hypothetical protein
MVFTAKFEPISPPELHFYGNDWKKYLEHYKLYMNFVGEHPEAGRKLTLDTTFRADKDNYVRKLVKSPLAQHTPPSWRKRDHGQVELSPDGESHVPEPANDERQARPVTQIDTGLAAQVRPRAPSQESVKMKASEATTPSPKLPEEMVVASKKKRKTKKPISPEEKARDLYSVYVDKQTGSFFDPSDKPSTAQCFLYLKDYLSHSALNQMVRDDRLPKTYRSLNNLCDQCVRLGGKDLELSQITSNT